MQSLDFLGQTYELRIVAQPMPPPYMAVQYEGTPELLGVCDNLNPTITLRAGMDRTRRLYTLIHEAMHAFIFLGHFHWLKHEDGRDDEGKIDALSSVLADFLLTNESVIREVLDVQAEP